MNIRALHPKKIAVIGSGISGLSCAWLLNHYHDVTLYEKDDRLGGHSNTVRFDLDGTQVDVDTGFIVFNPLNYPNLVELFKLLGVECCDTEMTFAVSADNGELEYNGTNLGGVFAQRKNLLRPRFWRMLADLLRFYRNASQMAGRADIEQLSLGELLRDGGYGKPFIYDHLLPMGAAIWSTPVDQMLEYPASSFLNFCRNHGLVQLSDRPQWRTVVGGSRRYVDIIAASLRNPVQLNRNVQRIVRERDRVIIEDLHGQRDYYDEVVLACHSDQALKLLDAPTPDEERLLSQFPYLRNRAYLHMDPRLMPSNRAVWSSWNYMATGQKASQRKVSVTYWMNRLQPLPTERNIFVSLNPLVEPAQGSIVRTFFYDHPAFGANSAAAQRELWSLQGQQRTWFCGAYFGYGFHEDGLQSGLAVAEQLGGVRRPWQVENPNGRIHVQGWQEVAAHG
ncbi:NAD(P)/FAD-dependent oxidoreductase [Marinobacterium zhoushanense]|nr:FAD-dependent oxidoreductase [Marinobacterium zhoushanense]